MFPMSQALSVTLNDGKTMPQLGLGVFQTPPEATAEAVRVALADGYRSIDTAAVYGNEAGVGEGFRASGLKREDVFITTKLWNGSQGFDRGLRACEKSLERLGLDHVDLYLIHWPAPKQDLYLDSWKALIRLRDEGKATSIGVSNFAPEHLERIIGETGVVPVLNQIELHPSFQQRAWREADAKHGVITESWSPLGQGDALSDPVLTGIARKHGKTTAQVVIRWHLDLGLIVIPKSVTPSRIAENYDVWDFQLDVEDLAAIDGLDSASGRRGPDPVTMG
jgi:2,5-diketo-D-gluconate reductase A